MALVPTLASAALRRSEAAALRWEDIIDLGEGMLTVRRSKTDAEGQGATVAVRRRPRLLWDSGPPRQGECNRCAKTPEHVTD